MAADAAPPDSIDATLSLLEKGNYVAERSLATAVFLALRMGRPLFLEGEAGVGKTEIAKVLAQVLGRELIRLQCYEGLDIASAVYEWNYQRQMIEIRLAEAEGAGSREKLEKDIFSERFLIRRPLLQALDSQGGAAPVLLIDELDRTDEPFEAYLLEVLADFQITIPEIGTIKATHRPHVVLTSNRSRELSDALRRRCLFLWIGYPTFEKELEIVRAKVPAISARLATEITRVIQAVRKMTLTKVPGVAETLDWATALTASVVPEMHPYPAIHSALDGLLNAIEAAPAARGWAGALVSYEALILSALGFGNGDGARSDGWEGVHASLNASGARLARYLFADRRSDVLAARERLVERLKRAAA